MQPMKIFLTALFLTSTLCAALPPLAQSSREIQAILSDPELQKRLGSAEAIDNILRTEKGYVIMTSRHLLRVDVAYTHNQPHIGPIPFTLEFHPIVEIR